MRTINLRIRELRHKKENYTARIGRYSRGLFSDNK